LALRPLDIRRLGVVPYDEALALQRELVEARKADRIPDTLLLLEHPHVLTLGVRGSTATTAGEAGGRGVNWRHIIATPERLAALGVEVIETGRGGDVTYHGPGQIVGYPIIDLRPDRQDVHRYVRDLEDVLIRTCQDFSVPARRVAGLTGAWVDDPARGPEKIAAIGVRIARWVTSHGFALNVTTALDYFDLIVPCGIADHGVTSLQAVLGRPLETSAVQERIIVNFAEVFGRAPGSGSGVLDDRRGASISITRRRQAHQSA
jgi:lipoyl(octanoyl) transferase